MMCSKCGMSLPEGSLFCSNCGNVVSNNNGLIEQPNMEVEPQNVEPNNIESIPNNVGNIPNNINGFSNENLQTQVEDVPVNINKEENVVQSNIGVVSSNNNIQNNYKKKKSHVGFSIIGVIALILIVIGILGVFFLKKSPKTVFEMAIDNVFEMATKYLQTEEINTISQNFDFQVELDLEEDIIEPEVYQFINNLAINGNLNLDYKNKLAAINLGAKYKNDALANASLYAKNNNIYASLGDLFDKYIEIPVEKEEYDAFFEILETSKITNDHITILNEIESALKKSLKKEYFKEEKTTVNIDGKDVNTTKMSLVIGEKEFLQISKEFLTTLNNDTFISGVYNVYASTIEMTGETITKEELKNEITASISDIEQQLSSEDLDTTLKVIVSMYVDGGNDVLKFDVATNDLETNENIVILDVVKLNDGIYSFAMGTSEEMLSGTLNMTDNNIKIKLEMIEDGSVVLKNEVSLTENSENDYKIVISLSSDELGTVKITMNQSQKYNQAVTIPNIGNKVLYTELSEEELQSVLSKLLEKESVQNLMTDVESLLGSIFNTSY